MSVLTKLGRAARLLPLVIVPAVLASACSTAAPTIPGLHDPDEVKTPAAGEGKKDKSTPKPSTDTPAPTSSQPPPPAPQGDQPPTLTAVDPQAVTVGTAVNGVDVTLTGTKFPAAAQVSLAGDKLPATFVSPTQLKVHIGPEKIKAAGVLRLLVVTSSSESNPLTFIVANPTSTSISQITPASVVLGAGNPVTLAISGSGFTEQSVVKFNGAALATTFTGSTSLSASIPSSAFVDAGRVSVTVALGTDVVSLPVPFEIRNPTPSASAASPSSITAGASAVVTLTGTGFTKGSAVLAGGQALSTTFVSATSLRATVPSNLAKAGNLALAVQNGTPGGGSSGVVTVKIAAADTTGGTATKKPDCAYLCDDYGYAPGQCYADYYCIASGAYAGCLGQASCGDAPADNAGGGGGAGGGAGGNAACAYECTDYGYAPGECANGWYCWISDGCLTQAVCNP